MHATPFLPLALQSFEVGKPLFGNQWLALLAISGLITLFIGAVALLGRWLAATHPDPVPAPKSASAATSPSAVASAPVLNGDVSPEIIPVIIAAVCEALGESARIASIKKVVTLATPPPSIEALMQQWSYEGRRQIYSSHKVR